MAAVQHTTQEENQLLGQTSAGTPMGNYLRRFWWPIAFSDDLQQKPTLIRLLSEDLVLFRETTGKLGLLAALCAHRRANLCFGSVTRNGLRCRYHGWVYDLTGKVVHTPGDKKRAAGLVQQAYPVQELGGLIFAYLGPDPAPLLPRLHYLVAPGIRRHHIQSFNESNWLQHAENGLDTFHASFLHHDVWQGFVRLPTHLWAHDLEWGVMLKHIAPGRKQGEWKYIEHPMALPGPVFGGDNASSYNLDGQSTRGESPYPAGTCRWAVPIDDTHTMNLRYYYKPEGQSFSEYEARATAGESVRAQAYLEYRTGQTQLGYDIPSAIAEQDATIIDSIGPLADRENEHLCAVDVGIALYRKKLLEQVRLVQQGIDPIGVIRDPARNEMIIRAGVYEYLNDLQLKQLLAKEQAMGVDGGGDLAAAVEPREPVSAESG